METNAETKLRVAPGKEKSTKTFRILIAGGYGLIGSTLARYIRQVNPEIEIILAGRNPEKAAPLASELGKTKTAYMDVSGQEDFTNLGNLDLIIAALQDHKDILLRHALEKGIAHIGITKLADEVAPITFLTLKTPPKRPVVLLGHWQAGALTTIAQKACEQFSHIDSIEATALYDTRDPIGPMVESELAGFIGRALLRKDGHWRWVNSKQSSRQLQSNDGSSVEALPMGTLDVPSLASITGAANIRFDLAVGNSIGTQGGKKASHDLYIDITGTLKSGVQGKQRIIASNPQGAAHFTALGVLVAIEHVLGLAERPIAQAGVHTPETFISPDKAIERFKQFGVTIDEVG